MSFASGPLGALPALATLANAWIGAKARTLRRNERRARQRLAQRYVPSLSLSLSPSPKPKPNPHPHPQPQP